MDKQEYSESGNPIYRYTDHKPREFTPPTGGQENIEAISRHIEKHVGKIEMVFHELISDLVHIDIYWVKPTEQYPFHSLGTSGMSDLPMNVLENRDEDKYAELFILLPENWNIDGFLSKKMQAALGDEKSYWPIRWLKILARFPHEYGTWVGRGHTIPNGKNAAPFANNTKFGCMLLLQSLSLDDQFCKLAIENGKVINFYCLYPLHKEEMNYKLKSGLNELLRKFDNCAVSDVVDIKRRNTCSKRGFWGLGL